MGYGVSVGETDGQWVQVSRQDLEGWSLGIWLMDEDGFRLYDPEGEGVPNNPECVSNCWITNRTWFTPTPENFIGKALMYAPGVMEAQARRLGVDLSDYLDGVALNSPADVGSTVWLKRDGGVWEGPFIVLDTSQRNHAWTHAVINEQSVEVGFQTALRWGMADSSGRIIIGGLENVEVWKGEVHPFHPTFPIDYAEYYLKIARFANPVHQNWTWTPIYSNYHTD